MNKQEFKQQLQKNGLKACHLAQNIGVSPATITNWNKSNKYPKYILYYFEYLELRRQVVSIMLKPDFIKKNKKIFPDFHNPSHPKNNDSNN